MTGATRQFLTISAFALSMGCGLSGGHCSNFIEDVPRVTVLDKTSMAPICDATVTANAAAGSFVLFPFSQQDGGCIYSGDTSVLRSGEVQVVVSRTGFREQTSESTIESDACGHPHDELTVLLEPQ